MEQPPGWNRWVPRQQADASPGRAQPEPVCPAWPRRPLPAQPAARQARQARPPLRGPARFRPMVRKQQAPGLKPARPAGVRPARLMRPVRPVRPPMPWPWLANGAGPTESPRRREPSGIPRQRPQERLLAGAPRLRPMRHGQRDPLAQPGRPGQLRAPQRKPLRAPGRAPGEPARQPPAWHPWDGPRPAPGTPGFQAGQVPHRASARRASRP